MAYIVDFYKTIKQDLDFKVTVLGDNGVIVEGFKSIIHYSSEHIVLRLAKSRLLLDGEKLVVREVAKGLLILDGSLTKFEVADL